MKGIASIADVQAVERKGAGTLPASTYEMIRRGAAIAPKAPALSFFLQTDDHRKPEVWTYEELMADIHRSANFFHILLVTRD